MTNREHPSGSPPPNRPNEKPPRRFQCVECPEWFWYRADLTRHRTAIHAGEHPSGSPQTEAGRAILDVIGEALGYPVAGTPAWNSRVAAIEREAAAARREPLDVEALRLYDTVAAMRAVIGHDHTEPWPCPVKAVDDALAALARKHGLWDRPTPDDLADNIAARLSSIPAREEE